MQLFVQVRKRNLIYSTQTTNKKKWILFEMLWHLRTLIFIFLRRNCAVYCAPHCGYDFWQRPLSIPLYYVLVIFSSLFFSSFFGCDCYSCRRWWNVRTNVSECILRKNKIDLSQCFYKISHAIGTGFFDGYGIYFLLKWTYLKIQDIWLTAYGIHQRDRRKKTPMCSYTLTPHLYGMQHE